MASVSIIVVAEGSPESVSRAVASTEAQVEDQEVLVVGDPAARPELWESVAPFEERIARVDAAGLAPAESRNAAVAAASGRAVVLVEGRERLARDAVSRHLAALDEDPGLVASYGRTAVHEGERVRTRPEHGRGGEVLPRLMKVKHLVASSACLAWRPGALGEAPFEDYATPPALRLSLAIRLARAGAFTFHPTLVAERDEQPLDLAALEELVKVFIGVLYAPDPPDEKVEQRARFRLARHLVAIGKRHYRGGDFRKAGKFFDEAVKAAPAYFKGRRYQFVNFVKRKVAGRS